MICVTARRPSLSELVVDSPKVPYIQLGCGPNYIIAGILERVRVAKKFMKNLVRNP
jgi:hypothetical protein